MPFPCSGINYNMVSGGIVLQLPHEGISDLDREIEVCKCSGVILGVDKLQNVRMVNRHHCHVGATSKGSLLYRIRGFRDNSQEA